MQSHNRAVGHVGQFQGAVPSQIPRCHVVTMGQTMTAWQPIGIRTRLSPVLVRFVCGEQASLGPGAKTGEPAFFPLQALLQAQILTVRSVQARCPCTFLSSAFADSKICPNHRQNLDALLVGRGCRDNSKWTGLNTNLACASQFKRSLATKTCMPHLSYRRRFADLQKSRTHHPMLLTLWLHMFQLP